MEQIIKLIRRWDSIKQASKALKIRSSLIVNVCNKVQKLLVVLSGNMLLK